MEVINIVWIVAFLSLQLAIVTVNYIIRSYLGNKPPGRQTLFDSVNRDFSIGNTFESYFALTSIGVAVLTLALNIQVEI
jgi:hypothetical protein